MKDRNIKMLLNGIDQTGLEEAVGCLKSCIRECAPEYGFQYPYFVPGGIYGDQWWQLDSSLALSGYKWIDRKFVETSLWNFIESQKEDGRICLWGEDMLPDHAAGGNFPKQKKDVSSLPKLFDVAYHILQGSKNEKLKEATYNMLKKYIDWWFTNRKDKQTGLITAVFEETFIPYLGYAGEYAPVDTNTEVYVGCYYTQLLAKEFGKEQDAEVLEERKQKLRSSINKYLWNEEKNAYYPYDIKEKRCVDCLMASTFFPLRLGIATEEQRKRLIELLKNHEHFNWYTFPLTSVSKLDRKFITTKGAYQGNASWSGNVWTLINEMVVRGLIDCNENELAAELALKTIRAFSNKYSEFINPFDGSGHGVEKYAWSASQYIELIVEIIFGIDCNTLKPEIAITPNLPLEWKNKQMTLKNIQISLEDSIDITIDCGKISYKMAE